jgi:hypothetical protein
MEEGKQNMVEEPLITLPSGQVLDGQDWHSIVLTDIICVVREGAAQV